jgi:Domain of unknown function (DUF4232)
MKIPQIALGVIALGALAIQSLAVGELTLPKPVSLKARPSNATSCAHEDLTIKEGETDAAMGGVRRTPFVITNVSKGPCTLRGYPALELLNKAGVLVKRATKQKSDDPVTLVTLEPGKTAWFALNFNAGGAGYMGKPCPSYTRVRVTLPAVDGPFNLRSEVTTCAKTDFEVTAISAGSPE